jgi:hypothetical protein
MSWTRRLVSPALALAAGALLAVSSSADGTKPVVNVRFEIVASKFRQNLPQRAQLEASLAQQVAQQFARRYRFADWPTDVPAAGAQLGTLVARLNEIPRAPSPLIQVEWFATFGADPANTVALTLPSVEVYSPTNPNWDTNNPADFEARAWSALSPVVGAEGFHGDVLNKFVRELPIASSVTAVADDRVIVVPLFWNDLLLSPESELIVRFSKSLGAVPQRGTLRLDLISPRTREPGLGLLEAGIKEASLGAQPLSLEQRWNQDLPALLGGAQIQCFIDKYRPVEFAGTSHGVVLDPN